MEYKALITGKNDEVVDDFFAHMDHIEAMTTSNRYADVVKHIKYFAPDVFVYCIYNESKEDYSRIIPIKHLLTKHEIPFVVVGAEDECAEFERIAVNIVDLTLHRASEGDAVQEQLVAFLEKIFLEKQKEAQSKNPVPAEPVPAEQIPNEQIPVELQPAAPKQTGQGLEEQKPEDGNLKKPGTAQQAPRTVRRRKRLFGRGRILVVDDNPLMLKVIKEHLHEEYDVATAVNGRVALRFLENRDVDLILLDYEMPEEDGAAVLEKIRKLERSADVPVIFLTGVSDRKKIKKALVMKPEGYLLKPIDHEKLISTIKKYVM